MSDRFEWIYENSKITVKSRELYGCGCFIYGSDVINKFNYFRKYYLSYDFLNGSNI